MAGTPIAKLVDAIGRIDLLQVQIADLSAMIDTLTRRVEAVERALMQRPMDERRP